MARITFDGKNFYKEGRVHQIISGAIHYFRVLPELWKDRLMKLKNCGFNSVETYICWSLHEKQEGKFNFSGQLDFGRFIDEAREVGLDVIIRPGPYICAETDFGGLPSWLLTYPDIELRCNNSIFMEKVYRYFHAIAPIISERLASNGGNIQMMQIENEYGSFGNDDRYKENLLRLFRECGFDCLLFTADGTAPDMLNNGGIEGALHALTFGSNPAENLAAIGKYIGQPAFCAEYWNGWFNCYGENHHVRSADNVCEEAKKFLELGASFNFYMFCGGTNFGMINGANYADGKYSFQTTSYDYGAPLTEAGDMTEKYYKLKKIIEGYTEEHNDYPVKNSRKKAYPKLRSQGFASLLDNLASKRCIKSSFPLTFEKLGVDFGYVLYITQADIMEEGILCLRGLRDRAVISINGKIRGVYGQDTENTEIRLSKADGKVRIEILVENRGRCNYGCQLKDPKGILCGVLYNEKFLMNFENYPLEAEGLIENISYGVADASSCCTSGFYRFVLSVDTPADTFLYPEGFINGCVYVNGKNIGRYCNYLPPQRTLYLPGELLKKGENEIVVFETDGTADPVISFFELPFYAAKDSESICKEPKNAAL